VTELERADDSHTWEGRTALVTGAGGGIGGAIATALAERGAAVGLVGRRRSALERVAKRIDGDRVAIHVVDLVSDAAVRSLVRAFLRRFGRLDVLVHSNGTYSAAPLDVARVADFDRLWASNVRSPFLLTQLLVSALRDSKGQIVFMNSSVVPGTPRPCVGHFSATQHALNALADTFRAELNESGVKVLSVYPGRTATERQRRIFESEGRPYAPEQLLQPEDVASIVVASLELPRTAEVTDIRIRPAVKH